MNSTNEILAVERAAYKALLPSLLQEHGIGKFALFVGALFVGAFTNYREALVQGYSKVRDGNFLVRQIAASEEVIQVASPVEKRG